ncbi:SMI1/KNR4 family protein [Sphingomonas naphthae]|uniref:SMI1/KNR4 family protein n=1 Tax=Sphingomonas naphthae TaxID=1813468 RepID=A0ABY7TSF6_9SPHN|nr:SMI1/KNR4 family protein [Sphingomonas naphthae]WCT75340.1 SMI1/KNR4 family protein [Sphingomonas naphthae]
MFGWLKRTRRHSLSRRAQKPPIDPALFEQEGTILYEALSIYWASSNPDTYTRHNAGVEIEALEERYSLQLPDDFRAYLVCAAPSVTFMDDIGTQWWALSEIKSISDECPNGPPGRINPEIEQEIDAYLIFSDYLIWCYAWAICCSNGPNRGKVALIGGLPDAFIADSFRDFLRLALADDLAIHQGPSK